MNYQISDLTTLTQSPMRGTLPIAITFTFTSALGRGQLGQKVAKNVFSWHPSGKHLVYGLFERYIGILLPKLKSSQAKNLPDTEKKGDL